MASLDIAVVVGSARQASLNLRLARAFMRLAPQALAPRLVRIDDLPFYSHDLEPARTPEVNRFTDEIARADGVLAVMPEFNRSIPAILKNAIDWGSKPAERNVWRDKPVAMAGISPGQFATAIGQQHLRQVLGALGALVMGGECYIRYLGEGFLAEDGTTSDASTEAFLKGHIARFADLVARLAR